MKGRVPAGSPSLPELPEVETTRRGIRPFVLGQRLIGAEVRNPGLRWPVPDDLSQCVSGQQVRDVRRRGKYLLIDLASGSVIVHFGMSGSLRIVPAGSAAGPHDHVDMVIGSGDRLRLRDPRRFGCVLWTDGDPLRHALLAALGPEPLAEPFDGLYLYRRSRGRRTAVKNFIMDSRIVAGIGNIYANEALFRSRIHPTRPCGRISAVRYQRLADAIQTVLREAIKAGGTTLRDFYGGTGEAGYFTARLAAYDRVGEACQHCAGPIRRRVIGQRASYYCPRCQR